MQQNLLTVKYPKASVLFLRHTKFTPDEMYITINTPGGNATYPVKVLKLQKYAVDEIFDKKLLFFIPFHIFVYENQFLVYNKDDKKLAELQGVYRDIWERLEALCREQKISAYTRYIIMAMSRNVLERIAEKYENIRKALGEIMGGKVLDYEAKRIYNAGKSEGRMEGAVNAYISLFKDGIISMAEAAKRLSMTEEEVQKHI